MLEKNKFGFMGSMASKLQMENEKKNDFDPNLIIKSTKNAYKSSDVGIERNKYKNEKELINPKLIESWIEDFLYEAEQTKIPGTLMKLDAKSALARYRIDRHSLQSFNISGEQIDRIYRCLFVYSVGFYEVLSEVLSHSDQRFYISSNIWIVFNILLEYCCRTEYENIITNVTKTHKDQLDKLNKNLKDEINLLKNNNNDLTNSLQKTKNELEFLEAELNKEKNLKNSISNELQNSIQMHEKEVSMRLKFEAKLNNLSSMYRELESRFLVVSKEFQINAERMTELYNELANYRKENKELNKFNTELQSKNKKLEESKKMLTE